MNNTLCVILVVFFAAIVITPAVYLILLFWGKWRTLEDLSGNDNDMVMNITKRGVQ